MIQGAINRLITTAAAVKTAHDVTQEKKARADAAQAKALNKEKVAKEKAMKRMADKVQNRWDQSREFKQYLENMGTTHIPDQLKQIAYEEWKRAPQVSIGGGKVDYFSLSADARAAIDKGVKKK